MTASTLRQRFGPIVVGYGEQVLAPRPWTLMQSEWAAELARDAPPGPILELCAGAGHIGLAAAVLCGRDLVQVEQSPVAAAYAQSNATAAGVADRIEVRTASVQDALAEDERFPLVIADPPYLRTDRIGDWPDDPVHAIDGGPDGLDLIRVCLRVAVAHLVHGGHLLIQLAGAGQATRLHRELPPGLAAGGMREFDSERAVLHLTRPAG